MRGQAGPQSISGHWGTQHCCPPHHSHQTTTDWAVHLLLPVGRTLLVPGSAVGRRAGQGRGQWVLKTKSHMLVVIVMLETVHMLVVIVMAGIVRMLEVIGMAETVHMLVQGLGLLHLLSSL